MSPSAESTASFGLKGVALFYAAAIAAGVWLWFRLHWALGGNFLIACAMAPLLLSTCSIHWLARPHVLSWIFLLLAIFPRKPNLIVVGLVTALWANVHASFFLAPVIALMFALEDRWYLKAAAVAAVAPLLNPYGPQLYVHVYRYLTDSDLLSRIAEFQSFDFHSAGAAQIIATVILGVIGGTLALTQKRLHHFALAILITAMALRSARALPLSALLLLPIANAAIRKPGQTERFPVSFRPMRVTFRQFRARGNWKTSVCPRSLLSQLLRTTSEHSTPASAGLP